MPIPDDRATALSPPSRRWGSLALLALVLFPWASFKLAFLSIFLAWVATRVQAGWTVERNDVRDWLFALCALSLVISPYWSIAPTIPTRVAGVLLTAGVAFAWSSFAASGEVIRPEPRSTTPWIVASFLCLLLGSTTFGPIEYRGDEDLHLTRPLRALEALQSVAAVHPLAVCGGLIDAYEHLLEGPGVSAAIGLVVVHLSPWLKPDDLPKQIASLRRLHDFCLGSRCLLVYEHASERAEAAAP